MRLIPRTWGLSARIAVALVPTLVLLLVAETGARLYGQRDTFETLTGFVEPDSELIWKLAPRAEGPLATNELGLRDLPFRHDARYKVLILGDSVSWGNGVADVSRVYPQILERQLEAVRPGDTFEVVNAGVPGYSTFQELRYLEKHGLALEPDVIVLQFCLNDVVERYRALAEYGGNRHFLGVDTRGALSGAFGAAIRWSRAFEMLVYELQHTARDYDEYRGENLARDRLSRENASAWAQTIAEIDAIRRLANRHEIPLVLMIAPYLFQVQRPTTKRQPQDRLLAYASNRGMTAVDLLPVFSRASRGRAVNLFNDASHFSERGHAIAAHALVQPVLHALDGEPVTASAQSAGR